MTSPGVAILFGGLIAWSIYRRVRRNIGRQPLRPRRAVISIIILTLVSALIVGTSLSKFAPAAGHWRRPACSASLLGFVGLRLTHFETTDDRTFLHAERAHRRRAFDAVRWTAGLSLLGGSRCRRGAEQSAAISKPADLFIFGLTAGYYIVYQAGLFKHSRDKNIAAKKVLHRAVPV